MWLKMKNCHFTFKIASRFKIKLKSCQHSILTIFLLSSSKVIICSLLVLTWRFFMLSTCLLRFSIMVSFSILYCSSASLRAEIFCSSCWVFVSYVRTSVCKLEFASTSLWLVFCKTKTFSFIKLLRRHFFYKNACSLEPW